MNDDDPGLDLSVRIGVNSEVVVTPPPLPERVRPPYSATRSHGRPHSAAAPAGVAVGEGTYRATERIFEYAALDPIEAKGKAHPVAIWRAGAPRAAVWESDVIRGVSRAPRGALWTCSRANLAV